MIYKFTLLSDESEDFVREIKIDSRATFFDFHQIILKSVGYKDDQMTSFFICSDDWEKEQEITLEDMGTSSSDEDVYVMRETELSEFLEDEKQRLIYIFDPLTERMFFIELSEIITGEHLDAPKCTRKEGEAPQQCIDFDEMMAKTTRNDLDMDENFYGDQDYDMDEFDADGFDFTDGNPYDNNY